MALPQIEQLIRADENIQAFALINEISAILPSDPLLLKYRDEVSTPASIRSDPAAIRVSYKPYGVADTDWQFLGTTPVEQARLPAGTYS